MSATADSFVKACLRSVHWCVFTFLVSGFPEVQEAAEGEDTKMKKSVIEDYPSCFVDVENFPFVD